MSYEQEIKDLKFPEDDPLYRAGSRDVQGYFKSGYAAALHQAFELAQKADAEISRLKKSTQSTSESNALMGQRLKALSEEAVEYRREINTLRTEVELHREIRRLRK